MKSFFQVGNLNIDNSKKTIVFIDKGDNSIHTHIYGAARLIKEKLKDKFNIITIGTGCKLTENYYRLKKEKHDILLRKADDPDYINKNNEIITNKLLETFKDLPLVDYIILGTDDFFRLPLISYSSKKFDEVLYDKQNEYFDFIDTNTTSKTNKTIEKINKINKKIVDKFDYYVSPIAFSTNEINMFFRIIDFINKTNRLKNNVIAFAIDPAIYTPFFKLNNIPAKFYYFADDKRGTRDFEKFDIAQFQHLVYDLKFDCFDDYDCHFHKTHNLFFIGTLFQTKGSRKYLWDKFLKDIESDNCSFYVPLRKNGIIKTNSSKQFKDEKLKELFSDLYNSITTNKNYRGNLFPRDIKSIIKKYKYGIVFRCVSISDSLNFRPILYTYMGVVPLLDYLYDPDYLQIPKYIQDKIVVKSSKDIDERISFFNNNPDERIKVLEKLNALFKIDEYINNKNDIINKEIKKIIPEFEI